jgi:antitoxin PrlF
VDVTAQLSSKGQLTVPKAVREALGLAKGDQVVFRVEGRRALLARTPSLLDLAGGVPVRAQKRGTPWPEVRRRTREARTTKTRA